MRASPASTTRGSPPGARSATATRSRRSKMHFASSRADEVVVSTHPPGRSNWLEQGVVEQARLRFDVPVTHVVVDLGAPT